jgi:phospholipase C
MAPTTGLTSIQHIVVLMLENRSFDLMLGFLYDDTKNVSSAGQAFEGLTGTESNPDGNGNDVSVFRITPAMKYAYYMPGADPGEHFQDANVQLFGANPPPPGAAATCQGFVQNFNAAIAYDQSQHRKVLPGTVPSNIMGVFTRDMLPILSGLARGYAVCDHWYSSVPTETSPNRAFACAATSQGHMDDATFSFTVPSIFGLLSDHGVSWAIYGYDAPPKTRNDFPDTLKAPDTNFGQFPDFQKAAANGELASYTFLEPSWADTGNSQHPNYNVALGEQLIHDVYYALRNGPACEQTLLIITYDEHGGCYDHVAPPGGATPPDDTPGEFGFDFTRFGVRVPAVLVSPLIAAGTVFRAPAATPIDHTSILQTVEERWLPAGTSLTRRDAAAPSLGGVLTLAAARTDDPLQGVKVPVAPGPSPFTASSPPSQLQQLHAASVARLPVPDGNGGFKHTIPVLKTSAEASDYIRRRTAAWAAAKNRQSPAAAEKPARAGSAGAKAKGGTSKPLASGSKSAVAKRTAPKRPRAAKGRR